MNKIITQLIAAGCLAALAPAASACEPVGPMAERHFDEVDTNHDGAISKAEADAYHNKRFKEIDANHDGKITRDEIEAYEMKMHENIQAKMLERFNQRFDEADTNHDGALTKAEAEKMPMVLENFDEIDTNHDGKITKEEISAMMKEHHGAHHEGYPADQPAPMKPAKE